jgi:hypothetical protein
MEGAPIITAKNPSPRRGTRQESPRRFVRKSFAVQEEEFPFGARQSIEGFTTV